MIRLGGAGKEWTRFTTKEGLGDDNAYALACDRQGRIWVGHLNHGVSVYNGQEWKNYDVLAGPLGERVFDIAVSPLDGDVWIATDSGLSRYRVGPDEWQYYTRAEGLPSDQIGALAFDSKGTLYVGTQCDGLAIGKAEDNYTTWRQVDGPTKIRLNNAGEGLPSALINDVLVARDGSVYVATPHGLGLSQDGGLTWSYVRGQDWLAKVKGLYKGPAPESEAPGTLVEDYVTCLAEDEAGQLWIGHWHKGGYEVWDIAKGVRVHDSGQDPGKRDSGDYVKAILLWPGAAPGKNAWVGRYMDGTRPEPIAGLTQLGMAPAIAKLANAAVAKLPSNAKPPTEAELATMLQKVKVLDKPMADGSAAYLGEDWTTQGDWVGRYGRAYASLFGMRAPLDQEYMTIYRSEAVYRAKPRIGPNHSAGDGVRHWIHWPQTDNVRTLYDPSHGYRRQTELDDHGESYPWTQQGPDLWIKLELPAGVHQVSLYFYNKDGHFTTARYRDYLIELRRYRDPANNNWIVPAPGLERPGTSQATQIINRAEPEIVLARMRVQNFWGGVYKHLLVKGVGIYWVKISRENTHNTICSGLFVDKLAGPVTRFDNAPMPYMGNLRYAAPTVKGMAGDASSRLSGAIELWASLANVVSERDVSALQVTFRTLALRVAVEEAAPDELTKNWRWKLWLWNEADRGVFTEQMRESWRTFNKLNGRVVP